MNPIVQTIILSASAVRMLPHIALYLLHKKEIDADLLKVQDRKPTVLNLIKACTREKSFRNLFYYRMGEYRSVFISWLLPPERTMTIWCPHIGKGAHLEHSYATYLNAESIGDDFDQKMMAMIEDEYTKEPNKAKVVSLTERLKPLFKAAAVVAIVLTLGNAAQVPFQNDVDNQIENVGYTKSGKGVSVAMGDSASVDSMQRTGIDQISTTTASPTILK